MHKSATKCNETIGKWCKNKHGASKIIDTLETYQAAGSRQLEARRRRGLGLELRTVVVTQLLWMASLGMSWALGAPAGLQGCVHGGGAWPRLAAEAWHHGGAGVRPSVSGGLAGSTVQLVWWWWSGQSTHLLHRQRSSAPLSSAVQLRVGSRLPFSMDFGADGCAGWKPCFMLTTMTPIEKPGYIVSCTNLLKVLQCYHRQPPHVSYPL
jgi:hypothetical protein